MPMQMTEAQAVNLVRNALLVAGQEMGREGDHWPVIKSTVLQIMKDHENLQIERNVSVELEKHCRDVLKEMEKSIEHCPLEMLNEAKAAMKDLWEMHNAYFQPIDHTMFVVCDDDIPIHIKRAETIISTLGGDHGV
jgi:thiamine pyrophosphate-dependent acetolactate synthase large subunit-like protein